MKASSLGVHDRTSKDRSSSLSQTITVTTARALDTPIHACRPVWPQPRDVSGAEGTKTTDTMVVRSRLLTMAQTVVVVLGVYATTGMVSTFNGILITIHTSCGQPVSGAEGLEPDAITAAALGGCSTRGGKKTVTGTLSRSSA